MMKLTISNYFDLDFTEQDNRNSISMDFEEDIQDMELDIPEDSLMDFEKEIESMDFVFSNLGVY